MKYHACSASLRTQITEHTEYNYVTAALYCVEEELENLMRTDREQTDRQTENSITEATLIPVDRRGERANINSIYYRWSNPRSQLTARYV